MQKFWGMDFREKIEPLSPQEVLQGKTIADRRRKVMVCTTNPAMIQDEASRLDMYSYHRGREGMEPRQGDNCELMCPLPPTDTNFDTDAPKVSFPVTIEFSLEDKLHNGGDGHEDTVATYAETVPWDLNDTSTPSPMEFATAIANQFGLSFSQTEDLALSIQDQIDEHLQHLSLIHI